MKQTRIAVAVVAMCTAIFAQAQEGKTNPFTGRAAQAERLMTDLEVAKLESAIANERLATAKASNEASRVGKVPPAEVRASGPEGGQEAGAPRPRPEATMQPRTPAKRASPVVAQAEAKPSPAFVPPLAPPSPPRLIGTAETPNGWVAMVFVPATGRVLNLMEGETESGIGATEIANQTARINGVHMTLEPVVARIAQADWRPATSPAQPGRIAQVNVPDAPGVTPIDLPARQ